MKLLNFYPAIPSERAFVNSFNENLQGIAKHFWHDLNGIAPFFIVTAIGVGVATCWYYYRPYNNKPGRHYKPSHWFKFMLICFLLTLGVTLGFEHFIKTTLNGAGMTMFWIALNNALYSIVVYFVMSLMWCNFLPTKAYRYLKLKKS